MDMTNSYECTVCNYQTKDRSNIFRHNKTKKHLKNISKTKCTINDAPENASKLLKTPKSPKTTTNKKSFKCNSCGNFFSRANNLTRHYKVCTKNNSELTLLKTQSKQFEKDAEYYKQMLMEAGGLVKKSVSALTYSIINYENAPHIKAIEMNDIETFNNPNKDIVEDVLSAYKHKTLNKYLGELILKLYKKGNPLDQSIWNTDDNRLTYIIKELLNDNSSNWIVDKKGVKTIQYLINPLLSYIKKLIISYQKNNVPKFNLSVAEIETTLENSRAIIALVNGIDDDIIAKDVLKYLSIHLRFNDKNLKIM